MTRINLVPPETLTTPHLVAEYRELPRVFVLASKAFARGEAPDDWRTPKQYTLGAGHVRFFYGKLGWCQKRQVLLIQEMRRRGFTTNYSDLPTVDPKPPPAWWADWDPSPAEVALNQARINDRLAEAARDKP